MSDALKARLGVELGEPHEDVEDEREHQEDQAELLRSRHCWISL
jgi:hypothetical protein